MYNSEIKLVSYADGNLVLTVLAILVSYLQKFTRNVKLELNQKE